ncbi:MAG TPA: Rieske 2Fe-2S domain-containing protein, partial [Ktedonobacterales bacterium]
CPHLKADLSRFAHIEDGVLTCTLHGWQFELATGRCLTSDDRRLYAQPIEADDGTGEGEKSGAAALAMTGEATAARSNGAVLRTPLEQPSGGASIRDRCYDCWYDPKKFPTAKKKKEQPATEE